ncbi:MAG TPA: YraN family protein [Allocoleopsis sp.]
MDFWADSPPATRNQTSIVGELGERLVAGWLQQQTWVILHHRWHCRWGEIDLIARQNPVQDETIRGEERSTTLPQSPQPATRMLHQPPSPSLLAFVEVKTRSRGNWDADGRLALTSSKQTKLWRTASSFLAKYPNFANVPCRFDVALVSCQRVSQGSPDRNDDVSWAAIGNKAIQIPLVQLGQPLLMAGYRLTLQDYIQSAFDLSA